MKFIPYICMAASVIIGLYEIVWISRSSLAIVIMLLSFIMAINSFALARREK